MEYENSVTIIEPTGNVIENYGSARHSVLAEPIYKDFYETIPESDRKLDDKSLVQWYWNIIGNGVRFKKDLAILRTRGEIGKDTLFVIIPNEITKEQLEQFDKLYGGKDDIEFSDHTNIKDNVFRQMMGVVDFNKMYEYLEKRISRKQDIINYLKVKELGIKDDQIEVMLNNEYEYNKLLDELREQDRLIYILKHMGRKDNEIEKVRNDYGYYKNLLKMYYSYQSELDELNEKSNLKK